jgi:hypothetical protein
MAGSLNLGESQLFKDWETGAMLDRITKPMQAEHVCAEAPNDAAPELTPGHQAASPKAVEGTPRKDLEQEASSSTLPQSRSSSSGHNKMTGGLFDFDLLPEVELDAAPAAAFAVEAKEAEAQEADSQMADAPAGDYYTSDLCPNNRGIPSKPGFEWTGNDQVVWDWVISKCQAKIDCLGDDDLQISYQ